MAIMQWMHTTFFRSSNVISTACPWNISNTFCNHSHQRFWNRLNFMSFRAHEILTWDCLNLQFRSDENWNQTFLYNVHYASARFCIFHAKHQHLSATDFTLDSPLSGGDIIPACCMFVQWVILYLLGQISLAGYRDRVMCILSCIWQAFYRGCIPVYGSSLGKMLPG